MISSSFQNEGGLLPSGMENTVDELDFSDPLWDFQWSGSTPFFDVTGSIL
jgi:hypothetical protein